MSMVKIIIIDSKNLIFPNAEETESHVYIKKSIYNLHAPIVSRKEERILNEQTNNYFKA